MDTLDDLEPFSGPGFFLKPAPGLEAECAGLDGGADGGFLYILFH